MFNSQANPIIQAWLDYIRLEDLANAKVEKERAGSFQRVFDHDISIVGNKLLLSEALFKQLKELRHKAPIRGLVEDIPLALTFPSIHRAKGKGQEQRISYHPLFTLDISSALQGNYRKAGWDLLSYEVYPISANLIEFCGLEEPEIDSLITSEGILRFLQDAFKRPFNTVQDFVNQVDLPTGKCKASRSVYLVRSNLNSYNAGLREDLRGLYQEALNNSEACLWLQEDHPASLYLFGKPTQPRHNVLFEAAFPGTIPDEFQAKAIKHAQENRLTAVFGGPGSGKTELILHLLAQPIYQRASGLVQGTSDQSCFCLIASTNNGAIQKIQSRLKERLSGDLFYLPGGHRGVIKSETLPRLREAADWLQNSEFDEIKYSKLKQVLRQMEAKLHQNLEQEPELQRQQSTDVHLLKQLEAELESLKQSIASAESSIQAPQSGQDYSNFPTESYRQIQEELEQGWEELPNQNDSWLKRVSDWMNVKTDRAVFNRLERRIRPAWTSTQTTPFPFQLPINREQLAEAMATVAEQLEHVEQWKRDQLNSQKIQKSTQKTRQQVARLEAHRQTIEVRLHTYPSQDFYTRFHQEENQLQVKLFQCSWQLLQQEALRRKAEVLTALRTYESALADDEDALVTLKLNPQSIYTPLSLIFPVISSSLQSLSNMIPSLESNVIRLAIVDEAGATPLHHAFPLLVRSHQAIFVGDPKQIEPIMNLCADTIKSYWESAFQSQGLNYRAFSRYAPPAKETATAYHRAAGAEGEGDEGAGILLANHYRSVPSIIAFCSPNYPGGLVTKTQPHPSTLGSNLLAFQVDGKQENRINLDEVDAIEKIVEILLKHGYEVGSNSDAKTIGVLSPFFHQAQALKYHLQSRWKEFPWNDISTAHQFQGGEKSVIIFSPSHCHRDTLSFINRRPNLLNTAVSRAQELFILIGNLAELEAAGGETRRLVRHIHKYGEVRELP